MTKKIVFGMAFALVIVGLMAPGASAFCNNSTSVSTYDGATGAYSYWQTTLSGPGTTLVAKVWSGGVDMTGSCNTRNNANGDRGILYFGVLHPTTDIGMQFNMADGCVPGILCPTGSLQVLATVNKGNKSEFLTTQAPQADAGVTFNFSGFGNHPLVAVPRPRITSSSPVGAGVNTNITIDPVSAGAYEGTGPQITGYNILSKLAGSDPGRNASAYDAGPTLAASGGTAVSAPVSFDCTGHSVSLSRRFVVTQIVTTGGPSPTVSEPVQVACDGSLADPGTKFKIVPKRSNEPNSKVKN